MPTTDIATARLNHGVEGFARLLAPGTNEVLLIDTDNNPLGWTEWAPAYADRVFAVHLAHQGMFHTLALDFDSKTSGPDVAAEDALVAHRLLHDTGIESIMIESGPGGGRHVVATIGGSGISPSTMQKLAQRLRALPLKSLDITPLTNHKTGAIRPPLSRHRNGGYSRVLDPTDDEAPAILAHRQDPALFIDLADALPRLAGRSELLRSGPPPGRVGDRSYHSGSEEIQAVATTLMNAGRTYSAYVERIERGDGLSTAALASVKGHRAKADLDRWLKQSWRNAGKFVAANPAVGTPRLWSDTEIISSWDGRITRTTFPNNTDRRVALALLEMACQQERALVGMPVRATAEAINSSKSSVGRALNRMVESGVIEVAGFETDLTGRRYRLLHSSEWAASAGTPIPPAPGGVRKQTVPTAAAALATDLTADAWTRSGLGESARLVYQALAENDEVLIKDLPDATGLAGRTVRTHLAALRKVGLARQLGGGRWAAEYRDATDVALDLGILPGAVEERRRLHDRERRHDRIKKTLRKLELLRERRGAPRSIAVAQAENRSQIPASQVPTDTTVDLDPRQEQTA